MTIETKEGVELMTHPETGEIFLFRCIITDEGMVTEGFTDSVYSHVAERASRERADALRATGHTVKTDSYSDPNTTYLLTFRRNYTNHE